MYDLRSDTVTLPTPAMREAMAAAEVGDDVYGEDPTVRDLERLAGALTGKAAALFVPSGTMGNQICLGVLARAGEEIIAEADAHILINEAGAASRLWGCQIRPLAGRRGRMELAEIEALVRPAGDVHYPRTAVVSIENTHNYAGGAPLPVEHVDAVVALARRLGLAVHCDGARLFNAAVALEVDVARLLRGVDLASICLSKGLGAPVGSVIVGDTERIDAARRLRKMLGGGMRQAGVIAAAARLALEQGPGRLAHDHRRARALAEALGELPRVHVDLDAVATNIVVAQIEGDADTAVADLAAREVAVISLDPRHVRFVFHRDLGDDALDAAVAACRAVFG